MDLITFAGVALNRDPVQSKRTKDFKPYLMEALNDFDNQREGKDDKLHRNTGGSEEAPGRDDQKTKGGSKEWIA